MSADWFCKIGDKKVGPLNNQQLKTFVAKGQLKPEHLVRRGSEGPWVPAGRIKGLFAGSASGSQPQAKAAPATAKPLPKAAKSGAAPAAKAAAEAPPPPSDLPQELALGGHHKHGGELDVDRFQIETTPVMVSRRKMKTGLQGLKKDEQKKVTVILMSVIGGGLAIGLILLIWAFASGKFSAPEPEKNPSIAALNSPDTAAKPTAAKKPADQKPAQAKWPTSWKKVSVETTTLGDVNVMVLKPFRAAPPKGIKTTDNDSEVLFVPVNLWLKDGAKKDIDLTSWADDKLKKTVFLKDDDKEGKGNAFELLGQVAKTGDMKAVTKERIQVYLLFELPAKIPKTMYIALPGAAFHADGSIIAYQFDKDDVGHPQKAAAGAEGGARALVAAKGAM
jgi:hypothetical protein